MVEIIKWPHRLLEPAKTMVSIVPFTRSGGRTLGGIERNIKSDRGFVRITLEDVTLFTPAMRRTWNAIEVQLGGKTGLVAVPAWSFDSAPYASGSREPVAYTTHSDGAPFSDGSRYRQAAVDIQMAAFAPLGATVVTLRLNRASSAAGIRFSYQHGLYKTGPVIEEVSGNTFRVPISPAIRMAIPAGAQLEVDEPTCLCHLADDRGMDLSLSHDEIDAATVDFVEAVDYWNDLALGRVA